MNNKVRAVKLQKQDVICISPDLYKSVRFKKFPLVVYDVYSGLFINLNMAKSIYNINFPCFKVKSYKYKYKPWWKFWKRKDILYIYLEYLG